MWFLKRPEGQAECSHYFYFSPEIHRECLDAVESRSLGEERKLQELDKLIVHLGLKQSMLSTSKAFPFRISPDISLPDLTFAKNKPHKSKSWMITYQLSLGSLKRLKREENIVQVRTDWTRDSQRRLSEQLYNHHPSLYNKGVIRPKSELLLGVNVQIDWLEMHWEFLVHLEIFSYLIKGTGISPRDLLLSLMWCNCGRVLATVVSVFL